MSCPAAPPASFSHSQRRKVRARDRGLVDRQTRVQQRPRPVLKVSKPLLQPRKRRTVRATVKETGSDSISTYIKSLGQHELLYKEDEHPDHVVVIKYVPFVGDSKRAMDE